MARAKKNLFTLLGWLVWKLLALVGLPMAKRKLKDSPHGSSSRSSRRRR